MPWSRTFGLAETVIGRRIDIAHPAAQGCAYDGFSVFEADVKRGYRRVSRSRDPIPKTRRDMPMG